MLFNKQPVLQNETVRLVPLQTEDFDALYELASDPLVWEQHPNKDRWKHEVFQNFFDGAMQSGGAFKIIDQQTGKVAGSTRMYDYNDAGNSILIGYTFFGRKYWGKGLNPSSKALLLNYLFQYVDSVLFHIGAVNKRSQIAIERLGATKIGEEEVMYFGETPKLNFVYLIRKEEWPHCMHK